jgi:hypothetical protein
MSLGDYAMIRWLWDLVYRAVPAEFESSYGLDESVERLVDATGRSVFSVFARQKAVGTVTLSRVSLQRAIPFTGNSFKPFFIGQFHESGGRVILTGRFTMLVWVKVFMSFWFGFLLLWTALALGAQIIRGPKDVWWFPMFGVWMLTAGAALVWSGRWFARNDAAWLSNVIKQALSNKPPNNRLKGDAPRAARA